MASQNRSPSTNSTPPAVSTRVRDNQRRSRARKKEYLNDLQLKYRACEQTGVTASLHLQNAARRVLDENLYLRRLLNTLGMSSVQIDQALNEMHMTSKTNDKSKADDQRESLFGPVHDESATAAMVMGGAARELQFALDSRLTCGGNSQNTVPTTPLLALEYASKSDQKHDISNAAFAFEDPHSASQSLSATLDQVSSSGQAADTSPATQFDPLRAYQPISHSMVPLSIPPACHSSMSAISPIGSSSTHTMSTIPCPTPHSAIPSSTAQALSDSTSCLVAAETIRSLRPNLYLDLDLTLHDNTNSPHGLGLVAVQDMSRLERELGCSRGERDCRVANTRVFGLLDEYSEPSTRS